MGIAVSTRSSDLRVAQQLSALANLPPVVILYLIAYNVIPASLGLALGLAVLLVVLDGLGWRVVASVFDRERMITSDEPRRVIAPSPCRRVFGPCTCNGAVQTVVADPPPINATCRLTSTS